MQTQELGCPVVEMSCPKTFSLFCFAFIVGRVFKTKQEGQNNDKTSKTHFLSVLFWEGSMLLGFSSAVLCNLWFSCFFGDDRWLKTHWVSIWAWFSSRFGKKHRAPGVHIFSSSLNAGFAKSLSSKNMTVLYNSDFFLMSHCRDFHDVSGLIYVLFPVFKGSVPLLS